MERTQKWKYWFGIYTNNMHKFCSRKVLCLSYGLENKINVAHFWNILEYKILGWHLLIANNIVSSKKIP